MEETPDGGDITIRRLGAEELERVVDIDVTEADDTVLLQVGTSITTRPEAWQRRPRDAAAWAPGVAAWRASLADGGAAWGAFEGERLVGLIILRRRIRPDTDQLQGLWVDRRVRRRSVARRLIAALEAAIRGRGARAIVVSATPSRSAVGTYHSVGFRPTDDPVPELVELEPEDIQMEKRL